MPGNWPAVNSIITETSGMVICEWAPNPLVRKSNYNCINSTRNDCTEQLKSLPLSEIHLQKVFIDSPSIPIEFRNLKFEAEVVNTND